MIPINERHHLAAFHQPIEVGEYNRCHLVRCLRARRHGAVLTGQDAVRAIADRKDVVVGGRLKGWPDDYLSAPAELEPIDPTGENRALHARRPDLQVGDDAFARAGDNRVSRCFGNGHFGQHAYAERLELMLRRLGEPIGKRRQDARPRFDQRDLEPLFIEYFESVITQGSSRVVEFGSKFNTRSAAANNRDADVRIAFGIGRPCARHAQTVIE